MCSLLYKSNSRPDQVSISPGIHQSNLILYYSVTVRCRSVVAGSKALSVEAGEKEKKKKHCQKVGQRGEEGWFVDLHFSLCSL